MTTLDLRNLTMESVVNVMRSADEKFQAQQIAFEQWWDSENARIYREPLELSIGAEAVLLAASPDRSRFLNEMLKSLAHTAWLESQVFARK